MSFQCSCDVIPVASYGVIRAPMMSFQRVTLESQKKDDVIPVLDTGIQKT
ncbi:hypothetical protein [Wolbachia endosymbiont (group A) of Agelastica alni]